MIISLLFVTSLAVQLPAPAEVSVLTQPATVTKGELLSSCATNTFLAQMVWDDLRATIGYRPTMGQGPLELVFSAASPPRLDTARDVARALRGSIEGCLNFIDVVPLAVRNADEASRAKWFDDTIARLFVISARAQKRGGAQRDYVFKGEELVAVGK